MKNIFKVLLGSALAVVAASSCSDLNEFPVFDEAESFVEFDKTTYNVPENIGQISIPVSIGAYATERTVVSYTILDASLEGGDYNAEKGVNFNDRSYSGVLIFDGDVWTSNIVIDIVNLEGVYTGDLKFAVKIESSSSTKVSAENTAVITISDLDHPLASILGEYTCTGKKYDCETDIDSYTITLSKDAVDVHTVHIDYITPGCKQYSTWGDWSYVGTVSADLKTITIARGQKCQAWYQTEEDVFELYTFEGLSGNSIMGLSNTGSFEMTQTSDGVWTTDANIWLYPVVTGSFYTNFVIAAPVWTKK